MTDIVPAALAAIKEMDPWLREHYIKLHSNPEEGFDEHETSKWVAEELTKLGYKVTTGVGKTGVVGILENGPGPIVATRSDMDCNAVKELTGLPYASTKTRTRPDGVTVPLGHQCGHDAHTVWLVAVGKIMMQFKDSWSGTFILIAQPAEEIMGGAEAMVKEGIWERFPKPDYLIAQHTAPLATGMWASGTTLMAGCDQLNVKLHGVGGHGSSPHTTKDPIVAASIAIMQMQTLVSRTVDPSLLTVGAIQGGTDNNIIPDDCTLKLNTRWFTDQVGDELRDGIKRIAEGVSAGQGLHPPEIVQLGSSPPLVNNESLVKDVLIPAVKKGLPNAQVLYPMPPVTGSEDCQLLIKDVVPGCKLGFMLVGTCPPEMFKKAQAEGKPFPWSNHSPYYQVDLNALVNGAQSSFLMIHELLKKK